MYHCGDRGQRIACVAASVVLVVLVQKREENQHIAEKSSDVTETLLMSIWPGIIIQFYTEPYEAI